MTLKFVDRPSTRVPKNVLLYGPPKTAKTAGACTMPGGLLLLNLDLPNASVYARSRDADHRIMEVDFEGMQTLIDVIVGIESEADGTRMVESVVVDPIGELHRRLLEEESNRAIRPTLNQYGDVTTHIERFCRRLCELPVNVCFVCHEFPVKDEASGQMERLPWTGTTNPSLGSKLMGMVDIIGYTGVVRSDDGGRQYVSQLVSEFGRRGGERFAGILGDFRPTDLAEWFQTIDASNLEATPKPQPKPAARKSKPTPQEVSA